MFVLVVFCLLACRLDSYVRLCDVCFDLFCCFLGLWRLMLCYLASFVLCLCFGGFFVYVVFVMVGFGCLVGFSGCVACTCCL